MNVSEWHKMRPNADGSALRVRVFWKGRWSPGTVVGVLPPRACAPPHQDEQMGVAVVRTEDGLDRVFTSDDIELVRS